MGIHFIVAMIVDALAGYICKQNPTFNHGEVVTEIMGVVGKYIK